MAVFTASSVYDRVDMTSLDFHDLLPADLNGTDAELTPTRILFTGGDLSETGYEDEYVGDFTFERDGNDAVVAVSGRVTEVSVYWNYRYWWGPADWDWYSISVTGLDVDVSVFLELEGLALGQVLFAGDDLISGNEWGGNTLHGYGGDDDISGNRHDDILYGGQGVDTLRGGRGDDSYHVDDARDTVVELAGEGTDTVYSVATFRLVQGVENLVLGGAGPLNAVGNGFSNEITGNAGANLLSGGNGADTVAGGGGADRLRGDAGADVLRGQAGADVFVYRNASDSPSLAVDRIMDFVRGSDRIDLAGIDANVGRAGNNAFTFIGTRAFDATSAAGQLRFEYDSTRDTGMLLGSTDADPEAEIVIKLQGVQSLAAADLVL